MSRLTEANTSDSDVINNAAYTNARQRAYPLTWWVHMVYISNVTSICHGSYELLPSMRGSRNADRRLVDIRLDTPQQMYM